MNCLFRVLYLWRQLENGVEGKGVRKEKVAQATGVTAALRGFSGKKKNKDLWGLQKEWTETEVRASKATTHRLSIKGSGVVSRHSWSRDNTRRVLPGLGREKKLLCCSVVQSPLFRWESFLLYIWESGTQSLGEEWGGSESRCINVRSKVSTVTIRFPLHLELRKT